GNVEFNFNTLEQYENGISGIGQDDQYSTKLTIASSVDWDLIMGAEDDNLVSTDTVDAAGGMDLGYITYAVDDSEAGVSKNVEISFDATTGEPDQLPSIGDNTAIIENRTSNAGDVDQNQFRIDWACGSEDDNAIGNLMGSDLTGGRYSTNVFFILQPAAD
ncbi:MAG: hypothetical protein ACLFUH_09145, partial [Bacteroidales bacterium]